MKSSFSWDMMWYSPLKAERYLLPASHWVLAWPVLWPRRWRRHFSLKHQLTFNGIHGIISQKIELFSTSVIADYSYLWFVNYLILNSVSTHALFFQTWPWTKTQNSKYTHIFCNGTLWFPVLLPWLQREHLAGFLLKISVNLSLGTSATYATFCIHLVDIQSVPMKGIQNREFI
jgi:hypothetical protein